jgi:hypothetical protein
MQSATEFIHQELNQEVTAAGGRYVLVKEVRQSFLGREVLYLVGHAAFDTTCCGVGGCAYALVPGFILNWKGTATQDGLAISEVESIYAQDVQQKLERLIQKKEMVQQVRFL